MKTNILFALKVNCVCKTEASVSVKIQLSQLNPYIMLESYCVYIYIYAYDQKMQK